MKDVLCEKLILANSLGVRLIYCLDSNVVELEIGAISMRLNPDIIQRVANVMMKASLQLDHIEAVRELKSHNFEHSRLQTTH